MHSILRCYLRHDVVVVGSMESAICTAVDAGAVEVLAKGTPHDKFRSKATAFYVDRGSKEGLPREPKGCHECTMSPACNKEHECTMSQECNHYAAEGKHKEGNFGTQQTQYVGV